MSRIIKLFVDAHIFDGFPQGTVTFLSGLYSELIKDSRFQLYVGSNDKAVAERFLGSTNFIHINYHTHSKLKRLLYVIPKVLNENKIDFAHFQYISPVSKPCKYIVTIHDLLFLDFPKSFPLTYRIKNALLFYFSAKKADLITTVSEYSRNAIHRHFNIKMSQIAITPNAVMKKTELGEPVSNLQNKKFILFVSRIEPRKNQALLIKAWKNLGLCEQGIDLVLVGSMGIDDNEFQCQIEGLSVFENDHFHWLSGVSEKNLIWLYQNCTLFVFPSSAEGFGIPPLEAALYGAKVICSNTTAMNEFGFFGTFQFNPNNLDEFQQALTNGLEDDFNHEQVITAITRKYNWGKVASNFGNLIYNNWK